MHQTLVLNVFIEHLPEYISNIKQLLYYYNTSEDGYFNHCRVDWDIYNFFFIQNIIFAVSG